MDYFIITIQFRLAESGNILPLVAGKNAHGAVETILSIRFFNIYLYGAVRAHLGMDDLCGVIQC